MLRTASERSENDLSYQATGTYDTPQIQHMARGNQVQYIGVGRRITFASNSIAQLEYPGWRTI